MRRADKPSACARGSTAKTFRQVLVVGYRGLCVRCNRFRSLRSNPHQGLAVSSAVYVGFRVVEGYLGV